MLPYRRDGVCSPPRGNRNAKTHDLRSRNARYSPTKRLRTSAAYTQYLI